MNFKCAVALWLSLTLLVSCTSRPKSETPAAQAPAPVAVNPLIVDPTPPAPPSSIELPADLKNIPAFLTLAIGGIADEAEKDGIEVQENMRLFRTTAAAPELLAFYSKEMKDRGWTTDNQVAQSTKFGFTMQEYRGVGGAITYLVISEPEDPRSSDASKSSRHAALLAAKMKKAQP